MMELELNIPDSDTLLHLNKTQVINGLDELHY